jgi:non-ribosomal peptide synthetase component E (peptide arylation enzyme)
MTIPWPAGRPRSLHYPNVGLDAVLRGSAGAYAGRVALRDGDMALTYTELRDRSLRLARELREHGVSPGDTVAIQLPNSIWFPVGYYAIAVTRSGRRRKGRRRRGRLPRCRASAVAGRW